MLTSRTLAQRSAAVPRERERFALGVPPQAIGRLRRDPDRATSKRDAPAIGERGNEIALPLGTPAVVALAKGGGGEGEGVGGLGLGHRVAPGRWGAESYNQKGSCWKMDFLDQAA